MSDTRGLLERGVEGFEPMPDAFERVVARRDRKRRNQRIAAGIVGAAAFLAVALWVARLVQSAPMPAVPSPQPSPYQVARPRNGEWVAVSVSSLDPDARPMSRGKPADLYVTASDGTGRLVAGSEGDATLQQCPAFSPDGSMLAYGETGGGEKSIVVTGFSAAGELTEPTILIPLPPARSFVSPCPVWAPDGQHLATIAPGRGVLIAGLDGSTTLIELDAYGLVEGGALDLEWSPDGSQLALLVSSSSSVQAVWLIPADGSAAHLVTGFDPRGDTSDLTWNSDGGSVIVVGGPCCDRGGSFVEIVDLATDDHRELALPTTWDRAPISRILAVRDDRFLVWRIWKSKVEWLGPDGSVTPIALAYPPTTYPVLSPDGKQLLYVTYELGKPGQFLVAVPLDGGDATVYSPSTEAFGDNYATLAWQPR